MSPPQRTHQADMIVPLKVIHGENALHRGIFVMMEGLKLVFEEKTTKTTTIFLHKKHHQVTTTKTTKYHHHHHIVPHQHQHHHLPPRPAVFFAVKVTTTCTTTTTIITKTAPTIPSSSSHHKMGLHHSKEGVWWICTIMNWMLVGSTPFDLQVDSFANVAALVSDARGMLFFSSQQYLVVRSNCVHCCFMGVRTPGGHENVRATYVA